MAMVCQEKGPFQTHMTATIRIGSDETFLTFA
jgi:hypothetical protein